MSQQGVATMDSIDEMIDKEDWSQITEPALRKRIQNRISQRKLRAKRKLQNKFNVVPPTPAMNIDNPDLSTLFATGNSNTEPFLDPMEALYPSIDLEWPASFDMNTPPLLDPTLPWSPDEITLDMPSWTTDVESGYFDHDPLPSDLQLISDGDPIPLDPALISTMDTMPSPQPRKPREFKAGEVLIHIDNPGLQTPRPDSVASSSLASSAESTSSRACPVKWSTQMLSRGFEPRCSSRSSGTTRKQSFRPWKKCTTTKAATADGSCHSSHEYVVECTNCGCHMAVRETPRPSQKELVEMLCERNPALAELAKQPNVRIEYGLPPSRHGSTRRDSTTDLEMEDHGEEAESEQKYIVIYTGRDRAGD
ncbi:uncharacterized protein PGRI_053840 [Penicillium griseofulvum]|uniref:BZIP domain-containing protein n=1 Tax=Penicillium patulum TaxID=5078 RepID=A0A135LC36_PENPA|nr:uncharacterized protein PGRI_053840 [Penicillium griseofulvum]KXG46528.1 hypothetical protein PGRI_053840 [Penicillium griseofulvum]